MQFRVLEDMGDSLFPKWDIALDLYIKSYLDIFITHTNIGVANLAEIIEYDVLCELSNFYEYSEIYMIFNLYVKKYQDTYIAAMAELFLNDKIDFYIDGLEQPTLSHYKEDKYQAWIYFRDNFMHKERFFAQRTFALLRGICQINGVNIISMQP